VLKTIGIGAFQDSTILLLQTEVTMNEKQFEMTPNVIEDKENRLRDLPFDELAEMFIQQGFVCREEMIERIIERMVRNHHPVTEEIPVRSLVVQN